MSMKIFFCYAHEDEMLLKQLQSHLKLLQRNRLIDFWYDQDINAGEPWEQEIKKHLNEAHLILLLISSDFIDSDHCYSVEMRHALERHRKGEAHVVPVILRPVYWKSASFGHLQALPKNAKPVTSWQDPDEGFLDVVEGIISLVNNLKLKSLHIPEKNIEDVQKLIDEAFQLGYLAGGGHHSKRVSNVNITRDENNQVVSYKYDES